MVTCLSVALCEQAALVRDLRLEMLQPHLHPRGQRRRAALRRAARLRLRLFLSRRQRHVRTAAAAAAGAAALRRLGGRPVRSDLRL